MIWFNSITMTAQILNIDYFKNVIYYIILKNKKVQVQKLKSKHFKNDNDLLTLNVKNSLQIRHQIYDLVAMRV